ncbi:MAG: hypothetical protein ABR884_03535 [Minisyncoccia bacterium]|jgi:hypothetical protein
MDSYRFDLSFSGQLVDNSVDAFDVANTILATSYALQEIAMVKLGEEASKNLTLNISAFKEGSMVSEFIYHFASLAADITPLLPLSGDIAKTGTTILNSLKTYIDIKTLLKGKPPESAKAISDNKIEININVNGDNNKILIDYPDFNLLQSQTLAKYIAKATQPLRKEDTPIEVIGIGPTKTQKLININKEDALYLDSKESFQVLPEIKYKGRVTKIDSKVRSGYINLGNRRIPFTFSSELPIDDYFALVESLKRRIQIFLIGQATMDYEGNPRSIMVRKVESEVTLL